MFKRCRFSLLLLAVIGNFAWTLNARANLSGNLTVEIDGFKNQKGQVCASIFANSKGFPNQRDRVLQKQCTQITDIPVKMTFENLKAGSYAIAVMHDQNKDLTLNRNGFGMPNEGFGFSRNPEVTTKPPKFGDAAFLVAGPNTKVSIQLKYL
ncbi:MAG: DUF2141 domain-containing protein [Goleter apudmare HA4340-LM2]|jgi:uncharacterized protein (DUF2141 family)|nr:DUF2141 domain-containing protein [Goleter apudmare HA4340-LM2]